MTDRTDHRAEAERLLAGADIWAVQAGGLSPKAGERACLAYAAVHALLAIHDTLTDLKPEPATVTHPWQNPLTVTHPWPPWPSTLPDVTAADRYAANEAKQREAAREATGGDPSASESENDAVEGGDADDAQNAILCPECDDHINEHTVSGCWYTLCDCPRTPEDVARAIITDGGRDG